MRILLISGSTRERSTNTAALRTAHELAPAGVTAVLYDELSELPAFNPDADHEPPHPAVERLRRELGRADAVLFCSPEYAGSLPGSLKNLLDWTVGSGDLYRRPVAWVNVAAEGRGGGAVEQLRTVLGYVDAEVIEHACLRLSVSRDAVGPCGTVVDDDLRSGLAELLDAIAQHVRRHR